MNLLTTSMTLLSSVYLGGENIGFSLKPNGVIISGTYDIVSTSSVYNPKNNDIRVGDLITEVEGEKVNNVDEFTASLKSQTKSDINLVVERDGKEYSRNIKLTYDDGKLKTGLYVKDSVLGVGTVTFYTSDLYYGALGHPVKETEYVLPLVSGKVYESSVEGIKKSEPTKVGEKIATLNYSSSLGNVVKNDDFGLSGYYTKIPANAQFIDVAKENEVHVGKAQICTVIENNKKEYFDIKITSVSNADTNKGLSIEVTDERLLNKTGGIVAGMSGSPIIQDGKLVGAVTHVLVSNPKLGYGVKIDKMIEHLS